MKLRAALALIVFAATVSGCCVTPAESHPAARAVEGVLEARRALRDSPSDYSPYFADSAIATALAQAAARGATGSVSPVPKWDAPYVSAATTSSAEVVVRWVQDPAHPGWPKASLFTLSLERGRWVIADAVSLDATVPPPVREN